MISHLKTIEKGRNKYYQQQLAIQLTQQITDMTALLTSNIEYSFEHRTKIYQWIHRQCSCHWKPYQSNHCRIKRIEQVGNAQIHLPTLDFENSRRISLRVRFVFFSWWFYRWLILSSQWCNHWLHLEILRNPPSIQNLSTSLSLSILDENQNELHLQTKSFTFDWNFLFHEIRIPFSQQWSSKISLPFHIKQLFNLHYVNITTTQSISVHLQIRPLKINVAYLFIYKGPRRNCEVHRFKKLNTGFCRAWKVTSNDIQDELVSIDLKKILIQTILSKSSNMYITYDIKWCSLVTMKLSQ